MGAQTETPDDLIESGYRKIKEALLRDLLEKVTSCTSDFFEKLVLKLLLQLGYGGGNPNAGRVTGRSGDGGIDGEIYQDAFRFRSYLFSSKKI